MGMAASQARLLTLTARIHDVEYQAQAIQNAKVQLATQSDQVYNKYLEALDETTMVVRSIDPKSGEQSTVTATYNNLFSKDRVMTADGSVPALRDIKGRLVEPNDIYEGYQDFKFHGYGDSAQEFAMYMMNGTNLAPDYNNQIKEVEEEIYEKYSSKDENKTLRDLHDKLLKCVHEANPDSDDIYDLSDIQTAVNDKKIDKSVLEDYKKTMAAYQKTLYGRYGAEIYEGINSREDNPLCNQENFSVEDFNYYVSKYNEIEANGGLCISIDDYNGFNGSASNDSEWLTAMVKSGQMTILTVTTDRKTGEVTLDGTSPSSDTSISYTETTTIDKSKLAKAEAKYEHDLKEIDRKDKAYDMTLSKLETQRNALTTEYDSVKKVISDNIERTFGIFS